MSRYFGVALLVALVLSLALPVVAFAAGRVVQEQPPFDFGPFINDVVARFLALAGFTALVTALIAVGKYIGLIPDGSAGDVSKVLNLIGLAAFVVTGFFKFDFATLDPVFASLASVLMTLLALLGQLGIKSPAMSSFFYGFFKRANIKVLGYSQPKPSLIRVPESMAKG